MVPGPGSAAGQSWALFGTVTVTCAWRERTPSPGPWLQFAGGVSFWQSPTLEGHRWLVSQADVSRQPPRSLLEPEPDGAAPGLAAAVQSMAERTTAWGLQGKMLVLLVWASSVAVSVYKHVLESCL